MSPTHIAASADLCASARNPLASSASPREKLLSYTHPLRLASAHVRPPVPHRAALSLRAHIFTKATKDTVSAKPAVSFVALSEVS